MRKLLGVVIEELVSLGVEEAQATELALKDRELQRTFTYHRQSEISEDVATMVNSGIQLSKAISYAVQERAVEPIPTHEQKLAILDLEQRRLAVEHQAHTLRSKQSVSERAPMQPIEMTSASSGRASPDLHSANRTLHSDSEPVHAVDVPVEHISHFAAPKSLKVSHGSSHSMDTVFRHAHAHAHADTATPSIYASMTGYNPHGGVHPLGPTHEDVTRERYFERLANTSLLKQEGIHVSRHSGGAHGHVILSRGAGSHYDYFQFDDTAADVMSVYRNVRLWAVSDEKKYAMFGDFIQWAKGHALEDLAGAATPPYDQYPV